MREAEVPHSFTAKRPRNSVLPALILFLSALLAASGCSIKQTVKVEVPEAVLHAKSASFEDLVGIIRSYERIDSLSCNRMGLTFTSTRKRERGELERYQSLDGYILLRRPDSVHFVLLVPVTKSRLFDVLSAGDEFSVWSPRENKFYQGKNSANELVVEDPSGSREFTVPIRGAHIFEAIFPQSVGFESPGIGVGVEEQVDARASYYVLTFIRLGRQEAQDGGAHRIHILRKIWIERSGLTIARQQVFADEGQIVSDIHYSNQVRIEGFSLPLQIHIDRPLDGYTLDLKFRDWRINSPDISDDAFELTPPPGAQVVPLREKGRSGGPK